MLDCKVILYDTSLSTATSKLPNYLLTPFPSQHITKRTSCLWLKSGIRITMVSSIWIAATRLKLIYQSSELAATYAALILADDGLEITVSESSYNHFPQISLRV